MRLAVVLAVAVALSGCVHTQPERLGSAEGRAAVNTRADGRSATLHVRGQPRRSVRNLHVGPDETTWVDRLSGQPESAPTGEIQSVSFRRGRNVVRSVLIGTGVGVIAGALASTADNRSDAFLAPVILGPEVIIASFGITGMLAGTVVGTMQTDRFLVTEPLEADTLAAP